MTVATISKAANPPFSGLAATCDVDTFIVSDLHLGLPASRPELLGIDFFDNTRFYMLVAVIFGMTSSISSPPYCSR